MKVNKVKIIRALVVSLIAINMLFIPRYIEAQTLPSLPVTPVTPVIDTTPSPSPTPTPSPTQTPTQSPSSAPTPTASTPPSTSAEIAKNVYEEINRQEVAAKAPEPQALKKKATSSVVSSVSSKKTTSTPLPEPPSSLKRNPFLGMIDRYMGGGIYAAYGLGRAVTLVLSFLALLCTVSGIIILTGYSIKIPFLFSKKLFFLGKVDN